MKSRPATETRLFDAGFLRCRTVTGSLAKKTVRTIKAIDYPSIDEIAKALLAAHRAQQRAFQVWNRIPPGRGAPDQFSEGSPSVCTDVISARIRLSFRGK